MVIGFGKWAVKEGGKKLFKTKLKLPSKPSKPSNEVKKGWKELRIGAINRKIKRYKGPKSYIAPEYAQEATDIYSSTAKTKKEYKAKAKGKK
jgi:hypothetical protein